MSMTIPTIPSLPAGYVVTVDDLNNLADAATFALTKPMLYAVDNTGGMAITTSWQSISFTSTVFSTDGMWLAGSPKRIQIQTPGWYKFSYGVNVGTVGGVFNSAMRATTGANNPQGSGVTSNYYWMGYSDEPAATPGFCAAAGDWPFYLYEGDFLQVFIQAAATGASTGTTAPASGGHGASYVYAELVSI